MTIYQIPGWDETFENNKSRDIEECSYVAMPNKQHGMGLTRILAQPDGAAIFGVWCLILQAASRQKRPRAGWLTDDGTPTGNPWDLEDMALRWRRPVEEIKRAVEVLCSPKVGWLKAYDALPVKCRSGAGEVPPDCPPGAGEVPSNHPRTEQLEQQEGREGNGTAAAPAGQQPATPAPPTPNGVKRKNREALAKLLRRLGLRATEDTITEWADLMQGRGGCKTADEALEGIAWIVQAGKRAGVAVAYAKDASSLSDQWAELLKLERKHQAEPAGVPA